MREKSPALHPPLLDQHQPLCPSMNLRNKDKIFGAETWDISTRGNYRLKQLENAKKGAKAENRSIDTLCTTDKNILNMHSFNQSKSQKPQHTILIVRCISKFPVILSVANQLFQQTVYRKNYWTTC